MPGPVSGVARDSKNALLSHLGSPDLEPSPRVDALLKGKPYTTGKTEQTRDHKRVNPTSPRYKAPDTKRK